MSEIFELPSLGADMDTGSVLEWYVKPGDAVERGAVVALVSTEKADVDVEIWQSGVVAELLAEVGREISVGTPLLRLTAASALQTAPATAANEPEPEPATEIALVVIGSARVAASPRARTLAAERNIDLAAVSGSGPGGAILERDLASEKQRAPIDRDVSMRRAIAARMERANTEIPHYHLELDVDLERTLTWLEQHNDSLDVGHRVLPAALLIKAAGVAGRAVPALHGFWVGSQFEPCEASDVAVVVSLRSGGLVAPTIRNVADRSVDEVMADLKEVVSAARSGSLRSSWMDGAGVTVTNLGDRGADRVHGVIFPPQVALVGFGRISKRPRVVDDRVVPRSVVTASLAADHRASDGVTGSRYLRALADYLKNPEEQ